MNEDEVQSSVDDYVPPIPSVTDTIETFRVKMAKSFLAHALTSDSPQAQQKILLLQTLLRRCKTIHQLQEILDAATTPNDPQRKGQQLITWLMMLAAGVDQEQLKLLCFQIEMKDEERRNFLSNFLYI